MGAFVRGASQATIQSTKGIFRSKILYGDQYVKNRNGLFEYILDGSIDTKLLDVRVFDEATKKSVYAKQTREAEEKGVSNCPLCAIGHNANKRKIWKLRKMDADHVAAWSKGGANPGRTINHPRSKLTRYSTEESFLSFDDCRRDCKLLRK